MTNKVILAAFIGLFAFSFVSPKQNTNEGLEGNWELVENIVNGKKIVPSVPQQFKVFNDGFFCFTTCDAAGKFQYSGAGTYELTGNVYKETFRYASTKEHIGASDWQTYEMKGDTLIFYGYTKATDVNNKDLTTQWGKNIFIEKRVRAKK
jgi:hypothetical protein